jgi:chorismate dehydratase
VATDDSSRTSAALVEIYLRKFVGLDPGFSRLEPNLDEMLRWHDAALLIGDPALKAQTKGYYVFDLAEEWRRWTGRPFVFAFWAVRKSALQGVTADIDIPRIFQQSRDNGLKHIPEIAASWAQRLELPAELITDYLAQNVDYYLDPDNLEGLRLFFRYGAECNVLPAAPELQFLAQPKFAAHR